MGGAVAEVHTLITLLGGTHLPAFLIVGQVAMTREPSCGELLARVGVFWALCGGRAGALSHRHMWM